MNKSRRAFGLSSLGMSAALVGGNLNRPRKSDVPGTARLHADAKLSSFEVNLAPGQGTEVVAAFARAQPGCEVGEILLSRSRDQGLTWQTSSNPLFTMADEGEGNQGYQHAVLTRTSDGSLIACATKFDFLFGGKIGWRRGSQTGGVYLRVSKDGGGSWSEMRNVPIAPFHRAWTRGPVVEMPDGTWLIPLAGQRGHLYSDVHEPIASFVMRSADQGVTWNYHATIAEASVDFDEPAMVSLGGERLLCALRSHDTPKQDPPGGYLFMAISNDGGATWTKPWKTSMWGHPASLLRLQDGRILCTYGYRMHPNPGVKACVSKDGLEWKPGDVFTVQALPEVASDRLQIGCPSSVELEAGRILTGYQVWASSEPRDAGPERLLLEASSYRI
jgi:hypothetical protein